MLIRDLRTTKATTQSFEWGIQLVAMVTKSFFVSFPSAQSTKKNTSFESDGGINVELEQKNTQSFMCSTTRNKLDITVKSLLKGSLL